MSTSRTSPSANTMRTVCSGRAITATISGAIAGSIATDGRTRRCGPLRRFRAVQLSERLTLGAESGSMCVYMAKGLERHELLRSARLSQPPQADPGRLIMKLSTAARALDLDWP